MDSRLVLGTAQFGMVYGIANRAGQVGRTEAASILAYARERGVTMLDTAIAYGQSEACLGDAGVSDWRIITKLPPLPLDCVNTEAWVEASVSGSLSRLRVRRLHGLLLHRPADLLGAAGSSLRDALLRLRRNGVVEKLGVSIYAPEELDGIVARMSPDIVQTPLNVLDRRILSSGWAARLRRMGAEVHVRSAFLQGLLLLDAAKLPPRFERWRPLWKAWGAWLDEHGSTPLVACIGFVLSNPDVDRVVIGVDSLEQLEEVLAASSIEAAALPPPPDLVSNDLDLIDPSRWSTT